MSTKFSVTLGSESPEPSIKRRKLTESEDKEFDYGTNVVLLKAKGEEVSLVHASKLEAIKPKYYVGREAEARWTQVCATRKVDGFWNVCVGSLDLDTEKDVVKFLAHWIQDRDPKAAFDAAMPINERARWYDFFFKVFRFCSESRMFSGEIHDSLTDRLIDWIREEHGDDHEGLLEKVYDSFGGDNYCPRMTNLITVYFLHHRKDDIKTGCLLRWEEPLYESVKDSALGFLAAAWTAMDHKKIPADPLEDKFDDYCRYHSHRKHGKCYRAKTADGK